MNTVSVDSEALAGRLTRWSAEFDRRFESLLTPDQNVPPQLVEAVHYSALAGGKRLRPFLVTRCCEICGGSAEDALPVAAAIECVHAFSLIHDDLPCMDDDDFRRGKPSNHKQFGEAVAILAGDALLALSFELIARHVSTSDRARAITLELARASGWAGMIGGQAADIAGESQPVSLERVEYIHLRKTAKLFEVACRIGAIAAGAPQAAVAALAEYGGFLGLAFQIADDLLDVTASQDDMGKRVGKDVLAGKQTFPAAVGVEESRAAMTRAVDASVGALEMFSNEAKDLRTLASFVVQRQH